MVQTSENPAIGYKKPPPGFPKGKSGNPGGQPKQVDFRRDLKEWLWTRVGGKTRLETILKTLAKKKPEVLLHYAFGKPQETIEIKGETEMKSQVLVVLAQHFAVNPEPEKVVDCSVKNLPEPQPVVVESPKSVTMADLKSDDENPQ